MEASMQPLAPFLTSTTGLIFLAGGLGLTASSLVDSTKILWGGTSNFGFGHIQKGAAPFNDVLVRSHDNWKRATLARWINGEPKEDQKRALKALIRIGMVPTSATSADATAKRAAGSVARACDLDVELVVALVTAQAAGTDFSPQQQNLSDRLDVILSAKVDAAFELADQQYRNCSKVIAGMVAIAISVLGSAIITGSNVHLVAAILLGVVAVPLAPVAKDAASALQSAAGALKARA